MSNGPNLNLSTEPDDTDNNNLLYLPDCWIAGLERLLLKSMKTKSKGLDMPNVHQQYYINPFLQDIDQVIAGTKTKYTLKQNCEMVNTTQWGCLSSIDSRATILIDGHGASDGSGDVMNGISNGLTGQRRMFFKASQIAEWLSFHWALPKSHIKIRMLGCELNTFARDLAICLGQYGFNDIVVGGYIDSVNRDGFNEATGRGSAYSQVNIEGTTHLFHKSQMAQAGIKRLEWYQSDGNEVAKPDTERLVEV